MRQRTGPLGDGILQGLVRSRLRSVTFGPRARGSQGRPLRRSRDWRQRVTARLALRGACWLWSGEWIGGPFREARAATRRETILEEGGGGGDKGPEGGTCRRRMRRALASLGGLGTYVKTGPRRVWGRPWVCVWTFLVGKCLAFGGVYRCGTSPRTYRHSLPVIRLPTALTCPRLHAVPHSAASALRLFTQHPTGSCRPFKAFLFLEVLL